MWSKDPFLKYRASMPGREPIDASALPAPASMPVSGRSGPGSTTIGTNAQQARIKSGPMKAVVQGLAEQRCGRSVPKGPLADACSRADRSKRTPSALGSNTRERCKSRSGVADYRRQPAANTRKTANNMPSKTRFTAPAIIIRPRSSARSFRNAPRYIRNRITVYRERLAGYFRNAATVLRERPECGDSC